MWLKTPLQNENTMLLSAHKHANLKCVFTYYEPVLSKTWSHLVSPVMARLCQTFQIFLLLLFLKAFCGNVEITLFAQ